MRKFSLAGLCLLLINSYGVLAQNKTLAVGVTTPNPNAALHVESPTANQGFILPRLTTLQRMATAFTSALGLPDDGLMVYDTDLNTIFIWNGISWQNTGVVDGGVRLTYPYMDSVAVPTGANDLFALKYNHAEPKRVMRIENQNASNGSSTLSVSTVGTGLAGYFQVANPATTSSALYATTNSDAGGQIAPVAVYGESTGTGSLGASFRVNNPQNTFPALFAETTGTGVSIMAVTSTGFSAIQGEATGGVSNGVTGISRSSDPGCYAILGTNTGAGPAGVFNIANSLNSSRVISSTTNGQGPAGYFEQTDLTVWAPALVARTNGQGTAFNAVSTATSTNANAAEFVVENTSNSRNAVMAVTQGMGSAGSFTNDNINNTTPAIRAQTNGPGTAIQAENTGDGNGFAGSFHNTKPLNMYPAIQASTAGQGSGVRVMQSIGTGPGMDVFMQNVTSTANGFLVDQNGLGAGGFFTINNATNTASGLFASTKGLGDAGFFELNNATTTNAAVKGRVSNAGGVAGAFEIFNTGNSSSAVYATTDGTGNAGHFRVNNASNGSPALTTVTNGTGAAFEANTATGFTAIYGRHEGLGNGNAGLFEIVNAANTYPALQVNTAGSGFAVNARHTGASGDAVYAEHAGGIGSAGNFRISNNQNSAAALYAATNAVDGNALGIANDVNGIALAVWNGGLQISTNVVTTAAITTRASAYQITGGGTSFTLAFGPRDGEVFMIFNDTGVVITVEGVTLQNGEGKTFIVFPGRAIRAF